MWIKQAIGYSSPKFTSSCKIKGLYEGLKAYRKKKGNGFLLFRPQENAARMLLGVERMCMPSPSIDQFVDAVKQTVIANKHWVPPRGKGALYVRPLLIGSGPILGLAPALEYTFLVYSSPVGLYFKEGLAPIELLLQDKVHRSCRGGTGGVKTITNYAPVLMAQIEAKSKGYADVLYVDSVDKIYLEEASSCNIFTVKAPKFFTTAPALAIPKAISMLVWKLLKLFLRN